MSNYALVAQNAYNIYRGSQRGENQKLFPHAWEGLPQHYRDLLAYIAELSWQAGYDRRGQEEASRLLVGAIVANYPR